MVGRSLHTTHRWERGAILPRWSSKATREKKKSITTRMAERSKYWPCHLNFLNSSLAFTTSWICLSVVQIQILGHAYK